ncbi:glycoside hydrolase family 9 protein [Cellulomonas timonensis]|uniref:glycoside hydrolase family 9 protein n=1 Tax=Cellulomonas timonensis TaxID=1689271 RepID=UPI000835E2D1|nr:glycoside hydrolase family 9 protein [Cellulomonas timonensis]
MLLRTRTRRHARRSQRAAIAAGTVLVLASIVIPPQVASAAPDPGSPVRVNQVAYVPGQAKRATLVSSATSPVAWTLRSASGSTVASGQTTVKGADALSGDRTHLIDFSSFDTTGSGYVLSADGSNSYPFDVSATPVKKLRDDSLAFFYHQRSGIAIEAQYVGSQYARAAGHLNVAPNQGDNAVPCRQSCGYTLDVRGGWYDAGDHGKYVVNGGIATWQLLNAYERTLHVTGADKAALGDGTLAIPERSNGVPDILDEARWEVDFLLKMQVPTGRTDAGMVHHKIHDENWTGIPTIPANDSQRRLLSPVSTAATLNMAAVAAQAARLWRPYDSAFADRALAAAVRAYTAAKASPNRLAPASDSTGGGSYEDPSVADEFYWAAAELYATTGSATYRADVTGSSLYKGASFAQRGYDWGWVGGLGDTTLAIVPTGLPAADVTATRAAITAFADATLTRSESQAYPAPNNSTPGVYYWGSNGQIANNANVIALAHDFTGQAKYRAGVYSALDYLQGRNPLNQSYISGYGEKAVRNVHHRFWANQASSSLPIAPPGVLSGGPNSELQDPYAAAQLAGCSAQKCFVDHIEAYSVNEVTVNWNSALAWLAIWAAEHATGTVEPTPTPTATPTPTTSPTAPAGTCKVTYSANSWTSGFTGSVNVTNTGSTPWTAWRLTFTFPGDQKVTQGWGGTFSQTGSTVTVTNAAWNGAVPAGGSVGSVGFNGSYSGANTNPTVFAVNGVACG